MEVIRNYENVLLSADAEEWWTNYSLTALEEGKSVPCREIQREFGFAEPSSVTREAELNHKGRKHRRHNRVTGSYGVLRAALATCAALYGNAGLDRRPSRAMVVKTFAVSEEDARTAERLLDSLGLLSVRHVGTRVLYQEAR